MSFEELRKGDRLVVEIHTTITGLVARTWNDENTGVKYVAIRTEARGERVLRVTDIVSQELISRDNEVPGRVTGVH